MEEAVMVWGAFANCKVEDFEGQMEPDRLLQHTATSHDPIWNAACGSRISTHAR